MHVPKLSPSKTATVKMDGNDVPKALIAVDEALVLPTKGKTAVKRIFLGVGWRTPEGAPPVDVDCCVAPYARGARGELDTVWYGNLHTTTDPKGYCFIKHSGDILQGQDGPGALEDLERLYVDLENCPTNYDCLAFEGNVFTQDKTFDALESCYIRLVNADTNQEIMRCNLGAAHLKEGKSKAGPLGQHRVILLAKLFRGQDRWVLHAAVEGRKDKLNDLHGAQIDMVIGAAEEINTSGEVEATIVEPVVMAERIERGEHRSARLVRQATQKARTGRRASRPQRSYLAPALAVGSAAGIAAAVALFHTSNPLSMEVMAEAGSGVDFSSIAEVFTGTDCGCLSDFICCGINPGEVLGQGFDTVCRGGLCDALDVVDPCEVFQPLLKLIGEGCFQIGELCTAGADCGSDAFADVFNVPCEDACDCGNIVEQLGAGCGGDCGSMCESFGGALGQLQDGCCCDGGGAQELMDVAGSAGSDLIDVAGSAGSALMEVVEAVGSALG